MTNPNYPDNPNDPNQFGNSYGLPAAPPPNEAPAPVFTPPSELVGAFWGYVVAALVGVIGSLLLFGSKPQIVAALRKSPNSNILTADQLQSAATTAIALAVVISVIVAALYVLFAFKLRAGRNWARIVLTIVAVLSLLSLLTGGTAGGSAIAAGLRYIGEVGAVIGAVLSYLPKSSAYIAAVKRTR